MTQHRDVLPPWPITAGRHPAALKRGERRTPHYPAPRPFPSGEAPLDPALVPWLPSARFAPPGPAYATLVIPASTVVLALLPVSANPAWLAERATEPTTASPPFQDTEVAADASSLTWTPPVAPPTQTAMWAAERPPPDADVVAPARMVGAPGRRSRLILGAALAVAAGVAGVALLPRLLRWNSGPVATFNAPMMVLRAAIVGRVTSIAVKTGQAVEPSTVLLTIHTEARPNPGASLLQDRAEAARDRLAALDAAPPDASPNTDAGRARVAEQRRQRAAITDELAQLQDQIASTQPKPATDQVVRAGVHGVIRSLEAQAGTVTANGVPLVRMLDCDHAFLTVAPTTPLHAGELVQVTLPNLPPVAATVRASAGIAEPPDALVIAPAAGAFVGILSGSCPIGATATVTPHTAGS